MLLFPAWVRVPRSWHDCWNDGTHLEVFNDSYQLEVDGEEIRVILGSFTYPQSNRSVENLLETNGNGTISIGWRKLSLISQILFHYARWWAQKSLAMFPQPIKCKMKNNWMGHSGFPVLQSGCLGLLWIHIGSLWNFPILWLLILVTFVLAFKMFKNILEKRKRFTIPMAVATASKSHFHEINNIIQFFLEFFFFQWRKWKK